MGAVVGALACHAAHLGDQLGWYDAVADLGTVTAGELAARTATDARYAQEWLEHQTVSGFLDVVDAAAAPTLRRYGFAPGAQEVLADRDSLTYVLPAASMVAGVGRRHDDLVEAYRTGGGVSWERHGDHARCGQAALNRPLFMQRLGRDFLASIAEVDIALLKGGPCRRHRVWVRLVVDRHRPRLSRGARRRLRRRRPVHRARPEQRPPARGGRTGVVPPRRRATLARADASAYDLVLALECIHDLADPSASWRRCAGWPATTAS